MFSWHLKVKMSKTQFLTSDFIPKIVPQPQQSFLFQLRTTPNTMESFLIILSLTLMFELSANSSGLHWKYTLDQTTFHYLFLFSRRYLPPPTPVQWPPNWSLCLILAPPPAPTVFIPSSSQCNPGNISYISPLFTTNPIASLVTQIKRQNPNHGLQAPLLVA